MKKSAAAPENIFARMNLYQHLSRVMALITDFKAVYLIGNLNNQNQR